MLPTATDSQSHLLSSANRFASSRRVKPIFEAKISSYGGIKWVVGEQDENAWGYGNAPRTENEFIERYRGLTEALLGNELMFGFCYTQLYDIEQEQNGLYSVPHECSTMFNSPRKGAFLRDLH